MFKGNPHADGIDPGFVSNQIFDYTYFEERRTDDLRYLIPDQLDFKNSLECSLAYSSDTIASESDIFKSLSVDVSLGIQGAYGPADMAFKASVSYNSMSREISNNKKVFVTSTAKCVVYSAAQHNYDKPSVSSNFVKGVHSLTDDIHAYHRFLDTFGTHYIKSIKMGSKYGFSSKFDQTSYSKMVKEGLNVGVEAAVSASKFAVELGVKVDKQKEENNKFDSTRESYEIFSVGSKPPADNKMETWA